MRPEEGSTLGHINRDVKSAGARSAGNPHAACDVAGVGDGITELPKRARRWKRRIQPRNFLRIYAPALDPTRCQRRVADLLCAKKMNSESRGGRKSVPSYRPMRST